MKSEIKRRAVQGDPVAQVEVWNKQNPVGTAVIVTKDMGEQIKTKTRSEAWVLSGHTAVVMVDGITGCYLLERVRPDYSPSDITRVREEP